MRLLCPCFHIIVLYFEYDRVERVKEIGIAGIKNFDSIKCLHCHYAHFLARPEHNNIVGRWVHEKLIEKKLITT